MRFVALFEDGTTCDVKARFYRQSKKKNRPFTIIGSKTEDLERSAERGFFAAEAVLQKQGSSHLLPDDCLSFQFVARDRALQVVDQSTDLLFAVLSAVTLVVPKSSQNAFSGTFAVTGSIPDVDAPGAVEGVGAIDKKFKAVFQYLKPGDKLIYPAVQDTPEESQHRVDGALKKQVRTKGIDLLPVVTVEEALQQVLPLLLTHAPEVKSWELRLALRRCRQVWGTATSQVLSRLVMPRVQRRDVYKFGLYGLAGAGKTCLLAALAMPPRPHPQHVTCTWIPEPDGMPRPAGESATWKSQDPAAAFHRGKDWLTQARARLLHGAVPLPNPADMTEPFRLFYCFTAPPDRAFSVEVIDYSGELLDPLLTNDASTLRLWEHMTALDGILVLAEFPSSHATGHIEEALQRLTQAFYNLQAHRKRRDTVRPPRGRVVPVALLVNKWDRHGALDYAHPEHEKAALDQFLERTPEPPHRVLADVLKVVAQGNFDVFPVSALGATIRRPDGTEIPQQVRPHLLSFGLEDGFIYLAHQRDKLDLAQYGADVVKRLCGMAAGLSLLVGLLVGGETISDDVKWRRVLATLQTPQATRQDHRAAIDWLRAYASAPGYRHLGSRVVVLSHTTAVTRLNELDERAWQGVTAVVDPEQQARLAQTYLDEYGANGKYRQEAQGIVDAAKQRQHTQANSQHLTDMHTLLQELQARGDHPTLQRQELQELRQRLQQLPHPEAVTQELVERQATMRALVDTELRTVETALAEQRRTEQEYENRQYLADLDGEIRRLPALGRTEAHLGALRASIDQLPHPTVRSPAIETRQEELRQRVRTATEAQLEVETRTKWQQFVEQYHALMQGEKQVIAAWQHLRTWQPKTADLEKLFRHFQAQMLAVLEAHWSGLLKQNPRAWPEARDAIVRVRNYSDILLTLDQQKKLKEMLAKIDAAEDRTLYEDVVRKQDRDSTARYLKDAPVKKKARVVQEYQKYLDALQSTLRLTLILERIDWGNTWDGYENTVTVYVNGEPVINQPGIVGRPKQFTPIGAAYSFTAKLNDRIQLSIKVVCQPSYPWQSSGNAGEGMYDKTVEALNGQTIPLQAARHENKATFRLKGIPPKPSLPDWEKP